MNMEAASQQPEGMVLRTEGLVKRYGKRTVVNDVSINVKQGEIVGLLGPNGALHLSGQILMQISILLVLTVAL